MDATMTGILIGAGVALVSAATGVLGSIAVEAMRGNREETAAEKARARDALYGLLDGVSSTMNESMMLDTYKGHVARVEAHAIRIGDNEIEIAVDHWARCLHQYAATGHENRSSKGASSQPSATAMEIFALTRTIQKRARFLLHGSDLTLPSDPKDFGDWIDVAKTGKHDPKR